MASPPRATSAKSGALGAAEKATAQAASTPREITFGILGCGAVTEVKSGPALYKAEHACLKGVWRRDAAKAEDFAARHSELSGSAIQAYESAAALCADPDIDVVYVATPPGSHLELALLACRHGKACYVEKPLARTAGEAFAMVAAFDAAGLPLYCGYYRRYLPKFLAVKAALPRVGPRVSEVRVRLTQTRYKAGHAEALSWRTEPSVAGGGLFMDLGSHQLDLVDWLVGPVHGGQGMASRVAPPPPSTADGAIPPEDNVRLLGAARDGLLLSGSWNFAGSERFDEIEVVGPHGAIRFSCFSDEAPTFTPSGGEAEPLPHEPQPEHVHLPIVRAIVDDLLRRREDPAARAQCSATGVAAARTNVLLDCGLERYYGSRSVNPPFWLRGP